MGQQAVYTGRWETLGKPLLHGESPIKALHTAFYDIFGFSEENYENINILGTLEDDIHSVVTLWPDATLCVDASVGEEELAKCRRQRDKYICPICLPSFAPDSKHDGDDTMIIRTKDRYFVMQNPYIYVQSLQGSTPWTAIGMVTLLNDPKNQDHLSINGLEMVLPFARVSRCHMPAIGCQMQR